MAKKHDGEEIDASVNSINYTEFTVKKKNDFKSIIAKIGLILLYLAIVVIIFFKSWWLGSLSLLAVVIAWYFTWPFTNIEYEYTTSSGNLKFVKIYGGGRKRTPVLEAKIKDMEIIAPYTDQYTADYKDCAVLDFRRSKKEMDDAYMAVFQNGSKKTMIIFRCTNKALKIFRTYNREHTVEVDTLKY